MLVWKLFTNRDGSRLRTVIGEDEFKGTALTHTDIREFSAARENIIAALTTALEKRFREFQCDDSNVISATQVADVASWPRDWETLQGCLDDIVFFRSCLR
jgi:hypothetical protein